MGAPVTVQQTFRFRDDDGSESGATWLGAGNGSDISRGTGTGNKFRIRNVIEETNNGNANNPWILYASYNEGTYFQVTTSTSSRGSGGDSSGQRHGLIEGFIITLLVCSLINFQRLSQPQSAATSSGIGTYWSESPRRSYSRM